MAGGLFDGKPFSINIKCIIVTLIIAASYWNLPTKSVPVALSILFGVPLAAKLYSNIYSCRRIPSLPFVFGSSILASAMYFFLFPQKHNPYILAALLYLPYLALAWWDYYYDCDTRMDPTIFPFGRYVYLPFKPPDYKKRWDELPIKKKQTIARSDAWFFWIAFAIFITYIVPSVF